MTQTHRHGFECHWSHGWSFHIQEMFIHQHFWEHDRPCHPPQKHSNHECSFQMSLLCFGKQFSWHTISMLNPSSETCDTVVTVKHSFELVACNKSTHLHGEIRQVNSLCCWHLKNCASLDERTHLIPHKMQKF